MPTVKPERYVRPTTAHNAVRDGLTYATAYGGAAEIPSGMLADTQCYLCDTWNNAAVLNIPAHNGTPTQRVVYRGDYVGAECSLNFVTATHYLNMNRSNTDVVGFKQLQAILLSGTIANIDITDNNFTATGNAATVKLSGSTGDNFTDVRILRNTLKLANPVQAAASAVQWFCSTGVQSTCTRVEVSDNTFIGYLTPRSVIQFRSQADSHAATRMQDMLCNRNLFKGCSGTAVEYTSPGTLGLADTSAGIQVLGNQIYDNTESSGGLGGGIGIWGFADSTTPTFPKNRIAYNRAYRIVGPTGFFDGFYGCYIVEMNYGEDISSNGADGNAILWDFNCHDSIARCNMFRNVRGKVGQVNSGCGVMILNNCTNINVYGNVFDGVRIGVFYGASGTVSSGILANNSFANISVEAVHMASNATLVNGQLLRNNLLHGSGVKVNNLGPAWLGENNNYFYGFSGANVNHTHGAQSVIDPTATLASARINPDALQLLPGSPLIASGTFAGHFSDATGRPFKLPTSIGAYEDYSVKTRASRT